MCIRDRDVNTRLTNYSRLLTFTDSATQDFLEKLSKIDKKITVVFYGEMCIRDSQYHVACLSNDQAYHHFDYKGVDCFTIKAPKLGPARVIAYDMMAINLSLIHI